MSAEDIETYKLWSTLVMIGLAAMTFGMWQDSFHAGFSFAAVLCLWKLEL